jgi:hypothetical protein
MTKEITLSQNQYLGLKVPTTDYPNEFIQFCEMFAYPSTMRKHKDQLAFARAYKISNNTLTNWKKTVDLPKLMHIVKERALKGDNKATDTLLKWLGELQDTEVQIDKAVIFTWAHDNSIVKPLSDIDSTVIDA